MERVILIGMICWAISAVCAVLDRKRDLAILASIWIMYLAQY